MLLGIITELRLLFQIIYFLIAAMQSQLTVFSKIEIMVSADMSMWIQMVNKCIIKIIQLNLSLSGLRCGSPQTWWSSEERGSLRSREKQKRPVKYHLFKFFSIWLCVKKKRGSLLRMASTNKWTCVCYLMKAIQPQYEHSNINTISELILVLWNVFLPLLILTWRSALENRSARSSNSWVQSWQTSSVWL